MVIDVMLERSVDYQTLESTLVKAAADVGWRAKVEPHYMESYAVKDGIPEFEKTQVGTNIWLRRFCSHQLRAYIPANLVDRPTTERFYLYPNTEFGVLYGIIYGINGPSQKRIGQYVAAVNKYLAVEFSSI